MKTPGHFSTTINNSCLESLDNQEKIPANPYPSITRPSTLFRPHKGAQALPMRPMNKLLIYSLKGEQKDN
jgi:hypothetical protein